MWLERMSSGGLDVEPGEAVLRLRLPSSLLNTRRTDGRTSIRCSDCEAVVDLMIWPSSANRGFETTDTPA
jgi:hypothetical protein